MITSVYALTDWQFWAYGIIFAVFVWFVLRGLGYLWLRSDSVHHNSWFEWFTYQLLLIALGLVSFTVLAFIFARFDLRILQWLVVAAGLIGGIVEHAQTNKKQKTITLSEKILLALIGVGSLIQFVAVGGSGLRNGNQIPFYFTNSQDGIMHLAFSRSLVNTFPPVRPELLNLPLTGYHYFTDLVLAEQARLLGIPITHAFFQYWPLLLSIMVGCFIVATLRMVSPSTHAPWFGLAFWYGSGELAYVWSLVLHQSLNWNVATIENSADQFLNMPQMFAKVVIFAAYYAGIRWYRDQRQKGWFFGALILIIAATGFKVYFGLFNLALAITLIILGVLTKHIAIVPKKLLGAALLSLFLPLLLAVLATAVIFMAISGSGSRLDWVPLAWPKLLLSAEHLDFIDWWLRMQVYEAAHSWKGIAAMNVLALLVAATSIIGTKLVGLGQLKLTKDGWWWQLTMLAAIIGASAVGMNTLQNPGGFNTYNFIIVAIQPLLILAALQTAQWWHKGTGWKSIGWKVLAITILLSGIPRPVANLTKYIQIQSAQTADAAFTTSQLSALAWVAKHTPLDSSIQAVPSNQQNHQSAFISFFAERPTALASGNIAVTHNLDYESRQTIMRQAFAVSDWQLLRANMAQLGIDYIYIDLARDQEFLSRVPDLLEHSVYQNETTAIIAL